jgi:hypothetical protein
MKPKSMRVLSLLLALACAEEDAAPPTGPVDGQFSAVRVYGDVRTATGAPASGVTVRLEAYDVASCTSPRATGETVVTDATGRFAGIVGNWGDPFDVCLRVRAVVLPGAVPGGPAATRPSVRVGGEWGDSVRVDLTLPGAE